MNVSELSDVELNRAMIWLYPPDGSVRQSEYKGDRYAIHTEVGIAYVRNFNYLTLWQYTMPLAVEHSLCIEMYSTRDYPTDTHVCSSMCGHASTNKNPLRAISEVLIMIAMEKKG